MRQRFHGAGSSAGTFGVMKRSDRLTFWHYVIWAPHSFFASVIFILALSMFLFAIHIRSTGRDNVRDDDATTIALVASVAISLIYWVPQAVSQYAFLRLHRRLEKKLAARCKPLREER